MIFFSPPLDHRGVNVRHNIECQTRKLKANLCHLRASFTCSISYCKDNIKCDIASNAPKCLLNNGVSIVQKLVVKLSNTSTTFSQQVEITFNVILTITNAISKTYLQAAQNNHGYIPFVTCHVVCNKSKTTVATCGAGNVYLSGVPGFNPPF